MPTALALDADAVQRRVGVRRERSAPAPSSSSTITPSPTRGAALESPTARRERERALGDHRREAVEDRQVGALQLARLTAGAARPLAGQHGDRSPPCSAPGWPASAPARRSSSTDDLALGDLAGRRTPTSSTVARCSLAHDPTQSVWYIVWPVAGRTWPTISQRPVVGRRRRAAGRRSRSRRACPTPTQPVEVAPPVPDRACVWSRTSSASDGHRREVCPITDLR